MGNFYFTHQLKVFYQKRTFEIVKVKPPNETVLPVQPGSSYVSNFYMSIILKEITIKILSVICYILKR